MKVIISDTSFIWNYDDPALEVFKEVLLVVCLEGKAVTDKYECFVSPYKHIQMGIDQFGTEDQRYKALESVADDLYRELRIHDDILFLTDGDPGSLYPFHVVKDRNEDSRLHLCAVSPWKFESKRRLKEHRRLLSDLSQLTSILYIDSNQYLPDSDKDAAMGEPMQKLKADYIALLPTVVNSIRKLYGRYYFDFASNSYVAVEDGFHGIDLSNRNPLASVIDMESDSSGCILGMISPIDYSIEKGRIKEEIEITPARIDGKKICEYLRKQRIELARVNGIKFSSEDCPSIGPCAGTCAKCDREAAFLRDKLLAIPAEKRIIPKFTLTEWEVEV